MTRVVALLGLGQVVLLAASLPLVLVAVRGYWRTPFGAVLAGLPVAIAGFLVSASAELLGTARPGPELAWEAGSVVGVLGFAWTAVHLVGLLAGWRRVGG